MPTNVHTDGKDLVTQFARGTVTQSADPVLLKPKGDPGFAPHFNISTTINNPAGTVFDHKTKVAHSESFMGQGKHLPIVIVGRKTGKVDGDNGFMNWAKSVFVEGRNAVMHNVQTGVNAIWSMLPQEIKNALENGGQIAGGMSTKDFADAARDDAEAMLAALKSTDTLIALAQTAALMGVSAIPVVGQLAGGAMVVQRLRGALSTVQDGAKELTEMMERWSKPMSPTQIAAERKKLASFLIRVGISVILAALGKAMGKLSGRSTGRENSTEKVVVGTTPPPKKTPRTCKIGKPVIIATGEKTWDGEDFALSGLIPLLWKRRYRSGDVHDGWFGLGWSTTLSVELQLAAGTITYRNESGRLIPLPFIEVGATHFDAYEKCWINRPSSDDWAISFRNGHTYHFNRPRDDLFVLPLNRITDRNANVLGLVYAAPPEDPFLPWRPDGIVDSAGQQLDLTWDGLAHLTSVHLRARNGEESICLASYQYSADHDLITHVDAGAAIQSYEWVNHLLSAYVECDGTKYCAEFDEYSPNGKVVRSFNAADGLGLAFRYSERARRTDVIDALGRVTAYEYDERKDIIAMVDSDGNRTEWPVDANGNPRGAKNELGRETVYRYDSLGNVIESIDPAGARIAVEYDAQGLPLKITDTLNQVWLREYDTAGNLISATDPLGNVTRYVYSRSGLPVSIVDAKGGKKELVWNANATMAKVTDCSGNATRFEYDRLGRVKEKIDALAGVTHYTWSRSGRLTELKDADNAIHRYLWSPQGRLLSYTDPLEHKVRYSYDSAGNLIRRVDAAGATLQYQYDPVGRLVALVNELGQSATFAYDVVDQLTDQIGFDGRHQRYCYDSAGELSHLVENGGSAFGPGKVVRFVRDVMGRLIRKEAEGAPSFDSSFAYDTAGRLLCANNQHAEVEFSYDPLGNLLTEKQTLSGAAPQLLAHSYDELGNRIRTALPDSRALNWLYYGSGHLHQIFMETPKGTTVLTDIERDSLHREVFRTQGGLHSRYEYDPMGRLIRHRAVMSGAAPSAQVDPRHAAVTARSYEYDAASNLVFRADALRGDQRMSYDPNNRIISSSGRIEEYFEFDPAGNLQLNGNGRLAGKAGDAVSATQKKLRCTFDIHGNLTQRELGASEHMSLTWDAFNQLVRSEVSRQGVLQVTDYEYDAIGRRTRKIDAFGATAFLWDGEAMVESNRGHRRALFVYEPDSYVPLATVQADTPYWYQCDQAGVPQELTDADGDIVWAADYRVWGGLYQLRSGTGGGGRSQHFSRASVEIEQPFRLQGQQYDSETGLHYNRFRYYDPVAARFVSQDPIGFQGGLNLYQYAVNPLGWIDPAGLSPEKKKCDCPGGGGLNPVTGMAQGTLQKLASQIREAGKHAISRTMRTIAVGMDAAGGLHAGSSNAFDAGQKAMADKMGITMVKTAKNKHAEENLIACVPGLKSVGTSKRDPCGPDEHDCASQLKEAGINVDNA